MHCVRCGTLRVVVFIVTFCTCVHSSEDCIVENSGWPARHARMTSVSESTSSASMSESRKRTYEMLARMSAPALMDVAGGLMTAGASDLVSDIEQRHLELRESLDDARPMCTRCGAGEDRLIRRPDLSQTLICGVCGTDTLIGMDFDIGRTFAYEDEDADSAPTAQSLVSAFGDLRTSTSRHWSSTGVRVRSGMGSNADALAADQVELRRCDRSDMVAALSEVIKAHARDAIGVGNEGPIMELPFEANARRRTQHCILARRRISNGANLLRMLVNCAGGEQEAANAVVVPRYRAVYDNGVQYLSNVGNWVGSREECVNQWRAVICDWYRGSGIQQRNYHVLMLIAIVRAGMVTGCLIPPERAVFEISQTVRLMRSTGLSSVHSVDQNNSVVRFYNRWDLICNSAVFTAATASCSGATRVLRHRCQFLMEQPTTPDAFASVNRKNDVLTGVSHDSVEDQTTYSWQHLVTSHVRWFAQHVFVAPHTRHGEDLIRTAERLALLVWKRRHDLNETKRRAASAFERGPVMCHSYWRFMRENERLFHMTALYRRAYASPWFTDVPVFLDSGAWACAIVNVILADGRSVQWRPAGLDVCDYMGRRVRDVMPFVAAIEAVQMLA